LDSMNAAITALSKGVGFFMQVPDGMDSLKRAFIAAPTDQDEKDQVVSLLSTGGSSGEIVGILKQMKEDMDKELGGSIETEEAAAKAFAEMEAAKNSEVAAATSAIEKKQVRAGELGVEAAEAKNLLSGTQNEILAKRTQLKNLDSSCATQKAEYEERVKSRNEELQAIGEAVKILNDDDALDIFKKTLPGGFVQEQRTSFLQTPTVSPGIQAYAFIESAASTSQHKAPTLSLIAYMLKTGKADFSKIVKMIDDMVAHLGKEQDDDDTMIKYCNKELNSATDQKTSTTRDVKDLSSQIDALAESISSHEAAIKSNQADVADTEAATKEATRMRKKENATFKEESGMLAAAKMLLEKAKNRLNKFYNPGQYKAPPVRELTEEERIAQSMGEVLPTEAPQMIPGTNIAVLQKSKKSGGVIRLMDMMIADVDAQVNEGKNAEHDAQRDYERATKDATDSIAAASQKITEEEAGLANDAAAHNEAKTERNGKVSELNNVNQQLADLHAQCDFLIDNFDFRKEARRTEVESMKNAKAVLSGANFS